MIEMLAARVFATRNAAHIAHWAAKGPGSHARHVALGEFYEALIDKIDAIVECHMGSTQSLLAVIPDVPRVRSDAIAEHIAAEAKWIAASRDKIANGNPSVANLLDDLHGLYVTTAYKLTFLA